MTRWEAFALAARIGAAGPRYRVRQMRLRPARQAGHELVVEDRRDGETFVVRSEREWWERLRGPEIELLAQRVRWAGGERAAARGDLVADYRRLAELTGGAGAIPVTSGRDLCRAVDALRRTVGEGVAPGTTRAGARPHARRTPARSRM